MAKAGFVLHGARGKVGNLVARKGENKTILAEYQPIVKNPQTNAQMAQRIILSTVAQAIPLLYPIIDHSFEGFAVGSKCTREFRRLNMSLLRQYAAVDFRDAPKAVDASVFMTTKGIKALIPNKYQISSGSLAAHKIKIARVMSSNDLKPQLPDVTVPVVKDGNNYKMKLGDLLTAIFGLTAPGEQLTFVVIQRAGDGFKYVFNGDDTMPGWVVPYTSMRAARLVLSPSVDFSQDVIVEIDNGSADYTDFIDKITNAFTSPKTDGSLLTWMIGSMVQAIGSTTFSPNMPSNEMVINWVEDDFEYIDEWCANQSTHLGHAYALGIIRSKLLDNGSWAYSNTFMTLAGLSGTDWQNYGLDWNSAIQAWFEKDAITDNSLFLKEGATANELGESFT